MALSRISRSTLGLLTILILYLGQTALYAFFTPAWESPDEPSHYLYTAYLARYVRPPNPSPTQMIGQFYEGGYVTSMYEWYHPALGYAWQAIALRVIAIIDASLCPTDFPPVNPLFVRQPLQNAHLFLPERITPYALPHADVGLLLLRWASALLGVPLIGAAYRAARLVMPDSAGLALTVAGLIAFIPQFDFISATLRNDTANNLTSALCILLLLRVITAPSTHSGRLALGCGGVLGIALLTKATAIFLLPAAALAFWLAPYARAHRAKMIAYASVALAIVVGTYLLCYVEARYALAHSFAQTVIRHQPTFDYFFNILLILRDWFWARFGWANIAVPDTGIILGTMLGLIGIAITLVRGLYEWRTRRGSSIELRQLLLLATTILLNLALVFRYNLYEFQPQGRFLFPSLVPLGILVLWGAWRTLGTRSRIALGWVSVCAMFAFACLSLTTTLIPRYYAATLPAAFQQIAESPIERDPNGTVLGQTFTSRYPNLSGIEVMLTARQAVTLTLSLREAAPDGREQGHSTMTLQPTEKPTRGVFSFTPIANSAHKSFYFIIQPAPLSQVTFWGTPQGDPYFFAFASLGD